MTNLGKKLLTTIFAVSATFSLNAHAQNLIQNPGFEENPPTGTVVDPATGVETTFGNNIGHSVAPWQLGGGNDSNVVQVDGPGDNTGGPGDGNYGNNGPGSDATAPGAGINQHYLDIANGSNDFYQSFTVAVCATQPTQQVTVSGAFSARGGGTATGSIRILNGTGNGGTQVSGPTLSVNTDDNVNWTFVNGTFNLIGGQTYTYIVSLNNPGNFDDASVINNTDCILAVDDNFTASPVFAGQTTPSVFDADSLSGAAVTDSNVTITLTGLGGLTGATINSDGTINVPSNATSGTYVLTYQICQTDDLTNCDTANATILIGPSTDLAITKTNTPGVNGNIDQIDDSVTVGDNVTYVLTVTNNGPDSVTGAVVTDTPGAGLSCPSANAVTITGDGVPAGSFDIGDLIGTGITLGTLADGQSATLSYSCTVIV